MKEYFYPHPGSYSVDERPDFLSTSIDEDPGVSFVFVNIIGNKVLIEKMGWIFKYHNGTINENKFCLPSAVMLYFTKI